MTGEDHDTDALIAALRSPALPSELEGEAAAVTAMLGVLSAAPAAPTGHRSRRGIAIAAVTVASLGVGGLVAAGPGNLFSPAADRPSSTDGTDSTPADSTNPTDSTDSTTTDDDASAITPPPDGPTSSIVTRIAEPGNDLTDDDPADASDAQADDCEAERHGDAVSEAAHATVPGDEVRDTARSDCGKPEQAGPDDDSPSDTAPGQTGDSPSDTAPGQTGDTPSDTAPGQSDNPSETVPVQTGGTPDTAPGQGGDSPADTAPARDGANRP